MLFTVILVIFVVTQTTKIIMPSLIEGNIVFYLMIFLFFMAVMNLVRNTFS